MIEQLEIVQALSLENDEENLYLSDRGYPSRKLFTKFIDEGNYFLMRVRKKFNTYFDLHVLTAFQQQKMGDMEHHQPIDPRLHIF